MTPNLLGAVSAGLCRFPIPVSVARRLNQPVGAILDMRILSTFILLVLACGCGPSGSHINWEYVIPNGYTGYLAIRFDCPEGVPLLIKSNTCCVVFGDDGTFCTSDKYSPSWSNKEHASTRSGKTIPIFYPPAALPEQFGLIHVDAPINVGGHTASNPGPDMVLLTYWVGNMSTVSASWPRFPAGEDKFLKRFGIIPPDEIK